jgi:hypothetical protein
MQVRLRTTALAMGATAMMLLGGCGGSTPSTTNAAMTNPPTSGAGSPTATPSEPPVPTESPVPVENNPPGDIPDNVAFVPYTSKAGGFTISTPEGWSRSATGDSVLFTDKLNTVIVSWSHASAAPTAASVKKDELPVLASMERAFKLGSITTATLPAGPAVMIEYQANSDPNAVTGKQYRLDVQRYELFRNGKEIAISLRSPDGSDNVDPWRIVTESFRWA